MIECEKNLKKLVSILSKEEISVIFEIGARDCKETIAFNHFFPNSKIYTYECNPSTIEICKKNVSELDNVILTEKAVSNQSGEITFYPINQEKTESSWKDGNPGASSIFKAKNDNYFEKYVQDKITVNCTTLYDEFNKHKIKYVDLLWMDIQGAELKALEGAKEYLNKIKHIHLEVEFSEIYENQPLFWEIKKFLNNNGFNLKCFSSFNRHFSDAVFVNRKNTKNIFQKLRYKLNNKILQPYYFYYFKFFKRNV